MSEIITLLNNLKPVAVGLYIDTPVSHSGDMAGYLRTRFQAELSSGFHVEVVRSADYMLKQLPGVICSSDSVLIDHADAVFDLACAVLRSGFGFEPPPLEALF